jgi:hypothetical protein
LWFKIYEHLSYFYQTSVKDTEIAQLKALVDLLTQENNRKMLSLTEQSDAHNKILANTKASYEDKLSVIKAEHNEHLDSIKREAAIKVKRVRNDEEQRIQALHQNKQQTLQNYDSMVVSEIDSMKQKISEAKQAQLETDQKAEEIFSHNRAKWRKHHEQEIQANGVKGEIDKMQTQLQMLKSQ